jgi:carbon-monoxide dehydrogenase medium subunit
VKIVGAKGERSLLLEWFFVGPGKTALIEGEIVTEVEVEEVPLPSGWSYQKLSLRKDELSVVNVAVMINLEAENRRCKVRRVVLGAVAPTVIRSRKVEKVLEGQLITEGVLEEVARLAAAEAKQISDLRTTAEYRREIVKVLTRRSLKQAVRSAR